MPYAGGRSFFYIPKCLHLFQVDHRQTRVQKVVFEQYQIAL